MNYRAIFAWVVLATGFGFADTLEFPESPRWLGMGGASVAVADDAHGLLSNPAGIGCQNRVAYEFAYSQGTSRGIDRFSISLVNPRSDGGGRFGTGVWTQAHLRAGQCGFIVPYSTTAWSIGALHAGSTLRFPLHLSRAACADVPKLTIVDAGLLYAPNSYRLGAAVERLIGGGADVVPRRLKFGGAVIPDPRFTISYEWQSEGLERDFDFHFESSRLGSEIIVGNYLALRGGYRWSTQHHISFGFAVGTLSEGWRIESGFDLPTEKHGETRWAAGLSYFTGGKKGAGRWKRP